MDRALYNLFMYCFVYCTESALIQAFSLANISLLSHHTVYCCFSRGRFLSFSTTPTFLVCLDWENISTLSLMEHVSKYVSV